MEGIWTEKEECGFAEFRRNFEYGGGRAALKVTVDFRYAAYINGRFVSGGQYADVPAHKSVDETDVTSFLQRGENNLLIVAFHTGEDFSVCRAMPAFVAFSLTADGKEIAASDEKTVCRRARGYLPGDMITPQLGYGWKYDFTDKGAAWEPCRRVSFAFAEENRPVKASRLSAPVPSEIVAQGIFKYRFGVTAAEKLQNAWMSTLRFREMTGKERLKYAALSSPLLFEADLAGGTAHENADGIFVIVDLKKETSGYLSLCVKTDKPCKAAFGWGEHLADLRIRTEREGRNFASELTFSAGENILDEYLFRMGARYLCLYIESERAEISRLTLRETLYPFTFVEKTFGDRLLDKIYETGRRTLALCAHEHYEDCPWREQALYGMDSRNQMLFGYGAFEEYAFPRASLRLFAQSTGDDGLLSLCAPSRSHITIPSFSVYWMIAVCENAEADFDESFVREMLPVAEEMLKIFESRSDGNGAALFTEPRYWNFHEWSDGLDGGNFNRTKAIEAGYDCILTALVVMAAEKLSALESRAGNADKADKMSAYAQKMRAAMENFYDPETGLYASYRDDNGLRGKHAYTQAAAILAGAATGERAKKLCGILKSSDGKVTEMTFAALQLKYDAVMRTDGDADWCVENICEIFGGMLFSGATSYWETANGEADFNDAGSLCHGWAAVACYVLDKYMGARNAAEEKK